MPLAQDHISANTPMGGHLIGDQGATFRVWAPAASAVYVAGEFNGWVHDDSSRLVKISARGDWAGFVPNARDRHQYLFHIEGERGSAWKRDPYARELTPNWPDSNCILRKPDGYPWHDTQFRTPRYHDMIVYQLHVGTFAGTGAATANFLDAAKRVPYLSALGITAVQLMPVVEYTSPRSMGYNGTDFFSPEMDYGIDDAHLGPYVAEINRLFTARGAAPITVENAHGASAQLKILVDLLHVYGIAAILDVVYNHAGPGFTPGSIEYFDLQQNDRLYLVDAEVAGGKAFAFWREEVRQFLIDNARFYISEFHFDGFRYDEVSEINHKGGANGWLFCQDLTGSVRTLKPDALQNAEYWNVNPHVVAPRTSNGAGFDTTQHDGLRDAIRAAVEQASYGATARVDMQRIANILWPHGFSRAWQAVTCVENHDLVYRGRGKRIPAIADGSSSRTFWAESRSRVATGLLLTAPGIPMLFMGQEILEDKQWHDDRAPGNLIWWDGLDTDRAMRDFLRFTTDLIRVRHRHPALRSDTVDVLHCSNDSRVLAFQRWLEGAGRTVVVVASLNDTALFDYRVRFPLDGEWLEVFNSDVYQQFPNPSPAGNGGRIRADGGAASITIPANSILVFARDGGD
jgi:1,4-alpha-glucan branching enzyme